MSEIKKCYITGLTLTKFRVTGINNNMENQNYELLLPRINTFTNQEKVHIAQKGHHKINGLDYTKVVVDGKETYAPKRYVKSQYKNARNKQFFFSNWREWKINDWHTQQEDIKYKLFGVDETKIVTTNEDGEVVSVQPTPQANKYFNKIDKIGREGTGKLDSKYKVCGRCEKMHEWKKQPCGCEYRGARSTFNNKCSSKIARLSMDNRRFSMTGNMKYTMGIEIEKDRGKIPNHIHETLNCKSVYDGSIRGGEYVTGVLQGNGGIEQLEHVTNQLNLYRHKVRRNCGLHVHIGGADFNRRFSYYMIKLGVQIQDEVFSIMSPSRQNNSYCRRLKPEWGTKSYSDINKLVAEQAWGRTQLDRLHNKKARQNRYNNNRYWWINLVRCNSTIEEGGSTCEFRLHGGTTSFRKIYHWSMICMAMVKFCENNQARIEHGGVTLVEILDSACPKLRDELLDWIDERRIKFGYPKLKRMSYYKKRSIKNFIKKMNGGEVNCKLEKVNKSKLMYTEEVKLSLKIS